MEFKTTLIHASFLAAKTEISCLNGKPFTVQAFKVPGRSPVLIQTSGYAKERQPGEKVTLARYGSGKYASWKVISA